jgi:hypothetical protein
MTSGVRFAACLPDWRPRSLGAAKGTSGDWGLKKAVIAAV